MTRHLRCVIARIANDFLLITQPIEAADEQTIVRFALLPFDCTDVHCGSHVTWGTALVEDQRPGIAALIYRWA